ncbi:MAG: hypothetical protein E7041_00250 [Lentisphaerae bacterium]|nr:hypothetical protein [Lentisphaerota bacterium]
MVSGNIPPLVWSLSRKMHRQFCPLAAVLHYREAQWGFDPDADDNCRRINQLHRVISERKYLRQLLMAVMRESFYRGDDDPDTLYVLALAKCEQDFRQMVFGNAPQITSGLFYHRQSVADLRQELKDTLFRQCAALTSSWAELLAVPPANRRFIASPLHLNINDLECYASPLLAYTASGKLRIVELRTGNIALHAPEIMVMHRFYALNISGRSPESVISCQLDPETGILQETAADFDISEILRRMAADAGAHRENMLTEREQIPENTVNCGHCVFASYCGKNIRKGTTS